MAPLIEAAFREDVSPAEVCLPKDDRGDFEPFDHVSIEFDAIPWAGGKIDYWVEETWYYGCKDADSSAEHNGCVAFSTTIDGTGVEIHLPEQTQPFSPE